MLSHLLASLLDHPLWPTVFPKPVFALPPPPPPSPSTLSQSLCQTTLPPLICSAHAIFVFMPTPLSKPCSLPLGIWVWMVTAASFCLAGHMLHRAAPGIEPRTSRTLSENHATRPSSQLLTLPARIPCMQYPRCCLDRQRTAVISKLLPR